jgi:hypothetical protein
MLLKEKEDTINDYSRTTSIYSNCSGEFGTFFLTKHKGVCILLSAKPHKHSFRRAQELFPK